MKKTQIMRVAGELAARKLSGKAFELYRNSDPCSIYEYENMDGEKRYAYSFGDAEEENLTFDELNETFESIYDEIGFEE